MNTVLFGLDGATFTVLDPLMRDGVMPNLAAFCRRGVRAPLASTPHPLTPMAWTSMATGRGMGHHGYADFVRFEMTAKGPILRFNTSQDIHAEPIWRYASRSGKRVTVLNYIGTAPPHEVCGHTMPGFVPGRHLRRSSHPPDLFDRLQGAEGFDVNVLGLDLDIERQALQEMEPSMWLDWIDLHLSRERAWFGTLMHLMTHEPSDLTMIVFDGVDKVQHLAYRFLDPSIAPRRPDGWETRVTERLRDYFRQVDRFLGLVMEKVGDSGRIFIASDHGFQTTTEVFYVNTWLAQNGFLRWRAEMDRDDGAAIVARRLTRHLDKYDWPNTRAFALSPSSNGIFIANVPAGEYGAFRARLIEGLMSIRAADGGRVIAEIKKREEWFAGPYQDRAPDLTLTLRDRGFISVLEGQQVVVPRRQPAGTHHPDGVLMGLGPGLKAGAQEERRGIMDVASLLAHSLGLDIPADYEGAFPESFYEAAALASDPPRHEGAKGAASTAALAGVAAPAAAAGMDEEDDAVIYDRLKSLGYIE